jgi:Asp-tRNA(Asn)/Glu-tRNA(Gln) amidotransferase A subunit family amidase
MSDDTELWRLTAAEAAERMRAGRMSAEELVAACLRRVEETEPKVEA